MRVTVAARKDGQAARACGFRPGALADDVREGITCMVRRIAVALGTDHHEQVPLQTWGSP